MTQKEMYEKIARLNANDAEIVDFCNHKIEQLAHRSSSKGMTKTQKANVELMDAIEVALANVERATVSEILNMDELKTYAEENDLNLSSQKISAMLRLMKNDERVEKVIEKKVAYFSLKRDGDI